MRHEYLSHIDILRALAVLLVIFNHLELPYFNGGFIGVDIFLVISGYLITKNIESEVKNTSRFSFKKFYQRRVIRLAPTFFTVMISCCLAFYFVLTTDEWIKFLKTLVSSVTLTSNIYYWTLLGDYFSINAKSTPLLHIWSLSLEEQFYLIWPLFLFLILKIKSKFYSILLLLFIILVSVSVSHVFVLSDPIAAYYLLPSRIFEFCIGSLIVFLPKKDFSKNISYIFTAISMIIILFASVYINKATIFPSYIALIPCIGAALFIYFSSAIGDFNFLSQIKYLGKISYPMYLWHWPIIVYLNINSIQLNLFISIAVILFVIALSVISYEKIEKTIKNYYAQKPKNTIKTFFILPSLIIIFISLIIMQRDSSQEGEIKKLYQSKENPCLDSNLFQECLFGLKENKVNIDLLLIGDSHANAQSPIVDILSTDAEILGYEFTQSTTIFLPDTDCVRSDKSENERDYWVKRFRERNDLIQHMIKKNNYRFVVMGGYFTMNYCMYSNEKQKDSKKAFFEGIDQAISLVLKAGAVPVIIQDNPLLKNIDINCNIRSDKPKQVCRYDSALHFDHIKSWNLQLLHLKQKYPKLLIIDFTDIICPDGFCYSYFNHTPLYRDTHHLTYTGATEIGVQYLKKYRNPFKPHDQ